jgi:hypothetical protein
LLVQQLDYSLLVGAVYEQMGGLRALCAAARPIQAADTIVLMQTLGGELTLN